MLVARLSRLDLLIPEQSGLLGVSLLSPRLGLFAMMMTPATILHLAMRFLEGRSPEVIGAVGAAALEVLKGHFHPAPEGVDLQITVEIEEIRKAAYFKDPPGTLGGPPTMKLV